MTISHIEVEIRVRPIDRRNAPINEATHVITGTKTEIRNWTRQCIGVKAEELLEEQIVHAHCKEDPYTD